MDFVHCQFGRGCLPIGFDSSRRMFLTRVKSVSLCGGGGGGGGGGGFGGGIFFACEDFGENVRSFIPCLRFFFFFFSFFEVEISSHTLIPLFMQGSVHSGSAS